MGKAESEVEKRFANDKSKNAGKKKAEATTRARQDVLNQYLQLKPSSDKGKYADPMNHVRRR